MDNLLNHKSAINAYQDALNLVSCQENTSFYIQISVKLGNALRELADLENTKSNLIRAIKVYTAAIECIGMEKNEEDFQELYLGIAVAYVKLATLENKEQNVLEVVDKLSLIIEKTSPNHLASDSKQSSLVNPSIFISYSREDGKDLASKLNDFLIGKGLSCWYDVAEMRAGQAWYQQAEDAITQTDLLIFILTERSKVSRPCEFEWYTAWEKGKKIIVILWGNTNHDLIPGPLKMNHALDFRGYFQDQFPSLFEKIMETFL